MHSQRRFAGGQANIRAHAVRAAGKLVASVALQSGLTLLMVAGTAMAEPPALNASNAVYVTDVAPPAASLAQPPSLTPRSSPYPTTGYPSVAARLEQPQFLAPTTPTAAEEFVFKDASKATASKSPAQPPQPPKTTPAPAPLKKIVAAPIIAPPKNVPAPSPAPKKRSRFWELLTGPSQPSSAPAAPTRSAPTNVNRTAVPPSGGSAALWNQLLGVNPPTPPKTSTPSPATTLQTEPLQLASAEDETASQRLPTLADIEAAKTPATSMTISRPGLMGQLGGTSGQAAATPTNPAYPSTYPSSYPPSPANSSPASPTYQTGLPPVPTVPTKMLSGITSALWRPLMMTNDAPTAAMPDEIAATVRPPATANLPESERVPSLLRPWYATNPPAQQPRTPAGVSRAQEIADAPQSLTDLFAQSSLGRQMSLANTETLQAPASATVQAQRPNEPWNGQVTIQWPLMANPFTMTDAGDPPAVGGSSVAQVAFLQEPLPVPSGDGPAPGDERLPGEDSDSAEGQQAGGDGEKKEPDSLVGAKTIGTAPEDNTLEFLRTQTVLLKPGNHQFDIGLQYTLTENDFPILRSDGMGNIVGVDNVEFKGRELAVPMELRYGLLDRVQGFIQVPVGWANVQAAVDDYDEYENDGGVGDIGFGLTAQLRDAYKDCPYLIGTIAGLAPTGGDPFGVLGVISPNAPSLGNGFWAVSGNLLWVQPRYDPVVLFYGLGARYQFEREYRGIEFQPGTEFNYTLGVGFAVNERVTLSTQFFGSYVEEIKANGERVEGTIQEPMNIRMAATLAKPCNRLVEPFVMFGLTDDSISSSFGITWTY
jgi:hypothetical protein